MHLAFRSFGDATSGEIYTGISLEDGVAEIHANDSEI